jgi:hypothetical protein
MRVECAVLCDAATLRENLLHILGAGLARTVLVEFPSPLPIIFALRVVLEPREIRPEHTLHLRLLTKSGDEKGRIDITFRVSDETNRNEEAALALPVPLGAMVVDSPGFYLIEASLDQRAIASFPVQVDVVPNPEDSAELES